MFLWLCGFLLVCARGVWEWRDPVTPSASKELIYIRDFATLLPAAACWYVAILRTGPRLPRFLARPFIADLVRRQRRGIVLPTVLIAAALSGACLAVSIGVFGTRANIVDEAGYLFQARVFALGRLWAEPPAGPAAFFTFEWFVLTPQKWYATFFPGESLVLALGMILRVPFIVDPLLTGVLLAVTVWAGRRLFDAPTGLLAGILMLLSPFVLLQGASYFSHILTAIFFVPTVVWILTSRHAHLVEAVGIGVCGGAVFLCRPLSAAILALFTVLWWIWQIVNRQHTVAAVARTAGAAALGAVPGISLFLAYNWLLTGHPFVTPHQVAAPDEAFGLGWYTIGNTVIQFGVLSVDLLGVPLFSVVPLLVYARFDRAWLWPICGLIALYALGYGLYPNAHALSYGPRFIFEIVPLLLCMASRGVLVLTDPARQRVTGFPGRFAPYLGGIYLVASAAIYLSGTLPSRLAAFHRRAEYYNIMPLVDAAVRPPAIVFVSGSSSPLLPAYLAGFQLNTPGATRPIIYARDLAERNSELLKVYPDRQVYRLDVDARHVDIVAAHPDH